MAVLFISKDDDPADHRAALSSELPDLEFRVWPDAGDPAEVEFALVWKPEPGLLRQFPNLKAIISLGAGVDHIFLDTDLPLGVPIVRLVDRSLTAQMSEYAILGVLRHHRMLPLYEASQRAGEWKKRPPPDTERAPVGILGLGVIGGDAARKLTALGFPVRGWTRTPRGVQGVECFHGPEGLTAMLGSCRFLACFLPMTDDTAGIIGAATLAALPRGAYVINLARGGHVVDQDLLAALDSGHIAGAMLDVFHREPLAADHPFWAHPKVTITPHIAGLTVASSIAPQVAENIRRAGAGQPLINQVDPAQEY
jgi:glyoxylate/hydroxypyruvate reductase A